MEFLDFAGQGGTPRFALTHLAAFKPVHITHSHSFEVSPGALKLAKEVRNIVLGVVAAWAGVKIIGVLIGYKRRVATGE